jgi:hypothetical protein
MLLDRVWINQLFTGVNKLNFKFKTHRDPTAKKQHPYWILKHLPQILFQLNTRKWCLK